MRSYACFLFVSVTAINDADLGVLRDALSAAARASGAPCDSGDPTAALKPKSPLGKTGGGHGGPRGTAAAGPLTQRRPSAAPPPAQTRHIVRLRRFTLTHSHDTAAHLLYPTSHLSGGQPPAAPQRGWMGETRPPRCCSDRFGRCCRSSEARRRDACVCAPSKRAIPTYEQRGCNSFSAALSPAAR